MRRFGVNALERYRDEIDRLREAGLVDLCENRLKISRGGAVLGHALGVDAESGFAVVQPLGRLDAPALEFSTAQGPEVGSTAILAAQGGMTRAIETHVVARQ